MLKLYNYCSIFQINCFDREMACNISGMKKLKIEWKRFKSHPLSYLEDEINDKRSVPNNGTFLMI